MIEAGELFRVTVRYGGRPKPIRDASGDGMGWEELTDGVIVAGQTNGAPSWFPCNDRPANKASYRIAVTAPSVYHVVANGSLVSRHRGASDDHLGLRAERADGDLPRHRADRPLRVTVDARLRRPHHLRPAQPITSTATTGRSAASPR